MYPGDVTNNIPSINVNSKLEVYNSNEILDKKFTTNSVAEGITTKLNNMIMANTEVVTEELYKGQLYANSTVTKAEDIKNIDYETKTTVTISNKNVADKVIINEGLDEFGINEKNKLTANTEYKTTKINLNKMKTLLGEDGNIEIKYANDSSVIINKDTVPTDTVGNIIITHPSLTSQLQIIVTPGENAEKGILEIEHTKQILEMEHNRETLQQVKTLDVKNTITAKLGETTISEKLTETSFTLKETISKAELKIENGKTELSTTQANELILGVTLITDGEQYDLYKNANITIQLPSAVETVEVVDTNPLYADEFVKPEGIYNASNKTVNIYLDGEQTIYPNSKATQLYLQVKLNVTLSKLATDKTEKIIMTYTNANATQYYGETTGSGVVEQPIQISAPSGLIKMYNLSLDANTSLTETLAHKIDSKENGKIFNFETILINNKETDMKNVRILGQLPTIGNGENTLKTTLLSIDNTQNATIYYTENADATADITKSTNGWTTNLAELSNAKLYLIKLEQLNKGDNYITKVNIKADDNLEQKTKAFTQYTVIYDTESETNIEEESRIIALNVVDTLQLELKAEVGHNVLQNADIVKEGEVIKYTASVKNNGTEMLENVVIKANIPEGTVLVEPAEYYVYYSEPFYYEEKTDVTEFNKTIPTLAVGETYTTQYEVRVKNDAKATQQEISNELTVTCGELSESEVIVHKLQDANIRVTIKRANDEAAQLLAGGTATYMICVENFSDKDIENLELQIVSNEYKAIEANIGEVEINENKILISKISANSNKTYYIYGEIATNIEQLNVSAQVTNANETYRSNLIVENLPKIGAQITLTSPQNNLPIKQNDKVVYNIIIKNTGIGMDGTVNVKDIIPEYLKVTSISMNDVIYLQTKNENQTDTYCEMISNEFMYRGILELETNETFNIKIEAEVQEIPYTVDGEIIKNKAEITIMDSYFTESNEVTHILDSQQKNIITGMAWIDENADGEKNVDEYYMSGITAKIYNISTKSYLADKDGNIITAETGSEGQYMFKQIPNGSYIIVFEHGMEGYEPTIYLVEGPDETMNSNAKLENIKINGEDVSVSGIKLENLQGNIRNMNIGLREKIEVPENPDDPGNTEDPDQPVNPDNPGDPENPENPDTPQEPEPPKDLKTISGIAWNDLNRDGLKDADENGLSQIKVRIYDVLTKDYLKDSNGKIVETVTDKEGKYSFKDIEKGEYIILFEYDKEEYEPTKYMVQSEENANSKVILKTIELNGEEKLLAVTDIIKVQDNVTNINIGLKEKLIFDLELDKYISRIVVQNSKETKVYDYENKTFAKVEIHKKQLQGSLVVLEYTIKVKNNGEMSGYVKNIVDYLPSGLTFTSELNTDWYLSGDYLHTKSLENVELKPGEEKEVKLILTKTMTNENIGLINNRAEIYQSYNKFGESDIDSTPNNQIQNEDDLGSADIIIGISTGGSITAYIILIMINIILIGIAIKLMINNKIIKMPSKRGRG